jgi:hypothetical protein
LSHTSSPFHSGYFGDRVSLFIQADIMPRFVCLSVCFFNGEIRSYKLFACVGLELLGL